MRISSEDSLKLNVLLANAQAIRIDERRLWVHGMTDGDDARVELHPTCPPEQYLRLVRELLSTRVLGSPRGYPVYLRRWTRLGEMHNRRLDSLLMLAEDEAVIAVARSRDLTDDLAARAWWSLPTAEVARYLLQSRSVVDGSMGAVAAQYLLDYLPFEPQPAAVIEIVRLLLQPGLLDGEKRRTLWQRGKAKNYYYVGFLQAAPDVLPDPPPAHPDYVLAEDALGACVDDPVATLLVRLLSAPGQRFLATCERVLRKPADQDVVVELLYAVSGYFREARGTEGPFSDVDTLQRSAAAAVRDRAPAIRQVLERLPNRERELRAVLLLTHCGEPLIRSIFARTDAVGSLMRRKIAPVVNPMLEAIATLRRA